MDKWKASNITDILKMDNNEYVYYLLSKYHGVCDFFILLITRKENT